jgi:hypothetical protein
MTLLEYIEKEEKELTYYPLIGDTAKKYYATAFKHLRELSNAKIFNNIDNFQIGFDDDRGGKFIYMIFDFYNDIGVYYIEILFYIEYGEIIVYPYSNEDERCDPYPWFRIDEILRKANSLKEIEELRISYINSDEYQKEKCTD